MHDSFATNFTSDITFVSDVKTLPQVSIILLVT